jgi:ribonuclease HI
LRLFVNSAAYPRYPLRLNEIDDVEWIKVAGHAGDPLNERCDVLARLAAVRAAVGET